MRIRLVILIILVASCARPKQDYIKPGKTTLSQIIQREGTPIEESKSSVNAEKDYVKFKKFSLQVKGEYVEAYFREPEAHETSLQYWRHLYKNKKTVYRKVNDKGHEDLWQFEIPEEKTFVTYDKTMNKVTGITKHE